MGKPIFEKNAKWKNKIFNPTQIHEENVVYIINSCLLYIYIFIGVRL